MADAIPTVAKERLLQVREFPEFRAAARVALAGAFGSPDGLRDLIRRFAPMLPLMPTDFMEQELGRSLAYPRECVTGLVAFADRCQLLYALLRLAAEMRPGARRIRRVLDGLERWFTPQEVALYVQRSQQEGRMSNDNKTGITAALVARPIIRHGTPLRGDIAVKPAGTDFRAGRFGRLFPDLKPLEVDRASIVALGKAMAEGGNNVTGDNENIPAGFTYLGQFIDHDITLDTTGIAERITDIDQVVNFRTPRLDLDCVYAMEPGASPQLYDRRKSEPPIPSPTMLLGRTVQGVVGPEVKAGLEFDLPRGVQGRALIGDHRNDENLLVAQTHVAFLRFHNAVARMMPNADFAQVRQRVTWHYQWMVLHDFLGKLVDMNDVTISLAQRDFYRFEELSLYREPYIPVEFSVAAYRLGHSMVRAGYSHNRVFDRQPFLRSFVFSGLSGNIIGELTNDPANAPIPNEPFVSALPSDWINDWRRFFDFGSDGEQEDGLARNRSRLIDPYLISDLHNLPGGVDDGVEDLARHRSLAVRNLARGVKMGLPSGQDVAERMKVEVMTPEKIAGSGDDGKVAEAHGLHMKTPLWYYILKEAQVRQQGARLGPVGSRILAEVFVGLLVGDPESFISKNPGWTPTNHTWKPDLGPTPDSFSMTDLIRVAFGSGDKIEDVAISPVDVAANQQVPPPRDVVAPVAWSGGVG